MSLLCDYFGASFEAEKWRKRALNLKSAMNRICWNGSFYTHFVKLSPVEIPGLDESAQLSLSNPMDINRGTTATDRAQSIIREYYMRRSETSAFAEWFSIDPPFPGGIMPLVGGELAKAAFDSAEVLIIPDEEVGKYAV